MQLSVVSTSFVRTVTRCPSKLAKTQVVLCSTQQQNSCCTSSLGHKATTLALSLALSLPVVGFTHEVEAALTAGDPIKNARALLRNALQISNKPIRKIQSELEYVSEYLRIPGSKALGPVGGVVRKSADILKREKASIIADFAEDKKEDGIAAVSELENSLNKFQSVVQAKDKQEVPIIQQECLGLISRIEEDMVKGFPFEVPSEYSNLPQLKGRCTLEMKVKLQQGVDNITDAVMTIVADGYNAPITAGNFVDLVNKGFYNGMEIQRADGFVVQTGDPDGPEVGYVDSKTSQVRNIPLEIRVQGERQPIYEFTLEDLGRPNAQPALPFNAFGTMALARTEFEANSGSSQIFWLLKESELTPSSANLLDGRYAVFGYVVDGQDFLQEMKVGDKIEYIKVLSGLENLVEPQQA
eukprot:TRINITY_DN26188_c0_g1_i1.p1 TRINITY_DN26188_c0_g1~~TRINITY_DN26188_c0_g1_i1.p1  ORF type:complete len:439 (-),score=46.29 TRINITY_DN26188_c0_g1_i1:311-1546(-)